MAHYKISLLWAAALLFGPWAYAQEPTPRLSSPATDVALAIPKVFLHLDRSVYAAGDTVWIASYNWLGERGQLDPYNQVVYVSLLNANEGEVLTTAHLTSQGIGSSYLVLPKTLATGNYTLEAYTRYMLNYDPSVRYRQPITVYQTETNSLNFSLRAHIQAGTTADSLKLQLLPETELPETPVNVTFWIKNRSGNWRKLGKYPVVQGQNVVFTDALANAENPVYIKYSWKIGSEIREDSVEVVKPAEDVTVEFFPESSFLVDGLTTGVAFKAQRIAGEHLSVSGHLVNATTGEVISPVVTTLAGLGTFTITPKLNQKYQLRIQLNGIEKYFDLPTVRPEGIYLGYQLEDKGIKLILQATPGLKNASRSEVRLQLAQGGAIRYEAKVGALSDATTITLDRALVAPGVAWAALYTSEGTLIAERPILVAPQPGEHTSLGLTVDNNPSIAGAVDVRLDLAQTSKSLGLVGASISVTEGVFATQQNGVASDITGYYYYGSEVSNTLVDAQVFLGDAPYLSSIEQNLLTLALLTSSSRKQLWSAATPQESPSLRYPIEHNGLSVYGRIHRAKKPLADTEVYLVYEEGDSLGIQVFDTDATGSFFITGYTPTQPSSYYVKPTKTKPFQQTTYEFASWASYYSKTRVAPTELVTSTAYMPDDSVDVVVSNRITKLATTEYELDQIEVTARAIRKPTRSEIFGKWYSDGLVDYTLNVAEMKAPGSSMIALLSRIPGVVVNWGGFGGRATIQFRRLFTGIGPGALILIDNIPMYDINFITSLHPSEVDHIDAIQNVNNLLLYGTKASGGIIAIYTKRGLNAFDTAIGVGTLSSIGLQEAQHFFNRNLSHLPAGRWPYRPTVYWETGITLEPGATKEITLFPNPDSNLIRIHVNGVTTEGLPVSGQLTYRVPN